MSFWVNIEDLVKLRVGKKVRIFIILSFPLLKKWKNWSVQRFIPRNLRGRLPNFYGANTITHLMSINPIASRFTHTRESRKCCLNLVSTPYSFQKHFSTFLNHFFQSIINGVQSITNGFSIGSLPHLWWSFQPTTFQKPKTISYLTKENESKSKF